MFFEYRKKEILYSLLEDRAFLPCYQEYSELYCCHALVLMHSPILEHEVIYLTLYLMHTRPVSHASSAARWIIKPPSGHSGEPACWQDVEGMLSGASSGWLLIQTYIYQSWFETPLDYRSPTSPEQILLR